jgi:hypothetical protein
MLEAKLDSELQLYVVGPLIKEGKDDYLIICDSEYMAKSLCAQISMGMLQSPSEAPVNYQSKGLHPNGHTKLFKLITS